MGIGFLVVVVALGAWVWRMGSDISVSVLPPNDPARIPEEDVLVDDPALRMPEDATAMLSTSDAPDAIAADLQQVTVSDLDGEFQSLDAEIEAL